VDRVRLCEGGTKTRSALFDQVLGSERRGTDRHAEHRAGLEEASADGRAALGHDAGETNAARAMDPKGLVDHLLKQGQRLDLSAGG
jgi:hypothetical protein